MKAAGKELLVLNNPRLIEEVVERDPPVLGPIPVKEAEQFAGDSVVVLSGDAHARRRALVEPLLGEAAARRYAASIVAGADAHCAAWSDGNIVDAEAEMEQLAADAIAAALFGEDLDTIREPIREFHRLSRAVVTRTINPFAPLLWRLPLPLTRRFNRARSGFRAAVDPLVVARRDRDTGDLLSALVHSEDSGGRLSVAQARDEAWTYYSQGPPGPALTWIWWLIGTSPAAEAALQLELDGRLAGRRPSGADLDGLEYTRAVVLEALRLYPPAMGLIRRAAKTFTLDGIAVPAGRWVLVSYFVLHRGPRFWSEPDVFRPERWLGDRAHEIPSHAYLPFALGPRRCPGRSFALIKCTLLVAAIASRWRLHPTRPSAELDLVPFLRPRNGLPMRLEQRSAGS
jgi:pentalenene oxygenase